MCPIQRLQEAALCDPVSDFIKTHKLGNTVTAQYQKKKQKSNLVKDDFSAQSTSHSELAEHLCL